MNLKTLRDTPPWEWPRNAGKIFRETLIDKRAKEADRVIAAELAGNLVVMNDGMADVLLAIVGSDGEPEKLRAKAAIALGPVLEEAYTDEFEDPDDVPITEPMFHTIQDSLRKVYLDQSVPKFARRRILEASVRAPEEWHKDAIREAYSSGDQEWILTAVFAMGYVRGFDEQILEALKSADPKIHFEAVDAAGTWELDAAWPHVLALVENPGTPKDLLIAAIGAVGSIRPAEAGDVLLDLATSSDEDIAEAANEAMEMAEGIAGMEDDEDDEEAEDKWVN
jgi:hypothetical protein